MTNGRRFTRHISCNQTPVATLTQDQPTGTNISLTIRPWMSAATRSAVGLVLPGCTADARSVAWVEVLYALSGAPLCYLRTLLQIETWRFGQAVDAIISGVSRSRWQSDCPQAELLLEEDGRDESGERIFRVQLTLSQAELVEEAGKSEITFTLAGISAQALRRFAAEMDAEIAALAAGQIPAPDEVPDELVAYLPGRVLNQQAYQDIQEAYAHNYLAEPFLRQAYEDWLATLPHQAHVLDVGCGHGKPIAAALAAGGYAVTGIDPSEAMIERAQQNVPTATLRVQSAVEVREVEKYDGICAFFSLLHMDPIELHISLHRLRRALKPGGHLLIVSGLPDLYTRASPFQNFMERPAWEWHTSHEEIKLLLESQTAFSIAKTEVYYPEIGLSASEFDPFAEAPEIYSPFFGDYPPLKTVFTILARRVP